MQTTEQTLNASPSAVVLVIERKSGTDAGELCAVIHFPIGFEAAPFSVGARGELTVAAVGVADIHLFLRFDGENVFASGAPAATPARLDGAPLLSEWAMLGPHGRISFGESELRVIDGNCNLTCCRLSHNDPGAATVFDPTGHQLDAVVEKAVARPKVGRYRRWSALLLLGVAAVLTLCLTTGKTARKTSPRQSASPAAAQLHAPAPSPSPSPAPKKSPLAQPGVAVLSGPAAEEPSAHPSDATPRAAVDALATGSFESAAKIYRQLAEETGSPVYRLAATLAGRKTQEARDRQP